MLRYPRREIVVSMMATAWLILSFSSYIVCGFDFTPCSSNVPRGKSRMLQNQGNVAAINFTNRLLVREDVIDSLQRQPSNVTCRLVLLEEEAPSFQ